MASPGRAYWKGVLRLSLVSIAVEIYNAVDTSTEIRFNQIHKPSGKRINYTKTVKGIGPIETSDIVKGFEVDKDQYVFLEPEELDAIKLESKKTLDLTQFVDVKDIDPRYFERPYYLVPQDDQAAEGYMVIREALTKMNKLGVGQVTMSGREYLVAVGPVDRGLVMEIMRYPGELKAPQTYFHDLTGQQGRFRNGQLGHRNHQTQKRTLQAAGVQGPLCRGPSRACESKVQRQKDCLHCGRRNAFYAAMLSISWMRCVKVSKEPTHQPRARARHLRKKLGQSS